MDERALFLLDDRKQAAFAAKVFAASSVPLTTVETIAELCSEIEKGVGVVVITQPALAVAERECLLDVLQRQPSWSEIPFVVLVSPQGKKMFRQHTDMLPTDVTLLDAPVRAQTLLSVVRTAIRGRRRQYAVRDLIDRLEQAKRQEQDTRKIAEAATRAKADFLAGMSHDLRTPLAGIIGMLELTLYSDIDDEVRRYVDMAETAAQSLLSLINDILDFSRAEAGKMIFVKKPFLVREAVRTAVEAVSVQALQKGLRLHTDITDDVPREVVGDEGRLRQVLVNLLGNAVKFTDHGEIAVSVKREGTSGLLLFSVTDTGIGISADKLDEIFGRYSQGDESIAARYGGTGIGLALSSELVEKMGGRMGVESRPGAGSTFFFTLPLPPASSVASQ